MEATVRDRILDDALKSLNAAREKLEMVYNDSVLPSYEKHNLEVETENVEGIMSGIKNLLKKVQGKSNKEIRDEIHKQKARDEEFMRTLDRLSSLKRSVMIKGHRVDINYMSILDEEDALMVMDMAVKTGENLNNCHDIYDAAEILRTFIKLCQGHHRDTAEREGIADVAERMGMAVDITLFMFDDLVWNHEESY